MTYEYLLKKYGTTLTFKEAAIELKLHWQTIRQMCLRGEIKANRTSVPRGKWILTTKALADYIDFVAEVAKQMTDIKSFPKTGKGFKKIV